jgi:hypothetical protein
MTISPELRWHFVAGILIGAFTLAALWLLKAPLLGIVAVAAAVIVGAIKAALVFAHDDDGEPTLQGDMPRGIEWHNLIATSVGGAAVALAFECARLFKLF